MEKSPSSRGSTTGLGHEIAIALSRQGARVALNFLNDAERPSGRGLDSEDAGGVGSLFQADVTDETDIRALVTSVSDQLGPIDILVVNATPSQPQAYRDYAWSDVQTMMDAFVKVHLKRSNVIPHMEAPIGSDHQYRLQVLNDGAPQFSVYVAAKGGQNGLNRSLAKELAPWNITVNMVSPWIPVERHSDVPDIEKDEYLASIPMGRWGTPADVAGAVTFFSRRGRLHYWSQSSCQWWARGSIIGSVAMFASSADKEGFLSLSH